MERGEFQHEQKANVRNSGEGLFKKPDSYTEAKDLLKNKRPLTRVCSVRQSSRTYPTSPSARYEDFGKCAVRVAQQHAQHVPVKNLMERSNSDSGYEVKCKGFEPPIIQDADFGKCEELTKNFCHSESLEKYYEFTNSYFSCYSESINTDEKPINCIQNSIQNLSNPMVINNQTNRFRIKSGMTKGLCSYLFGITHNSGLPRSLALPANGFANAYRLTILALLRMFALYRNDGKFLVPQCLSNLVPFSPLSLPSPSRGEGHNNVKDLFTPRKSGLLRRFAPRNDVNNLSTPKKKVAFTLAEILITLGIIGVVAAMTIPTLIANTNGAKFRSQFKKSISTLNQAGLMVQAQYGFNYAGTTPAYQMRNKCATAHPETNTSFCAILNGVLTGQTYIGASTNLKRNNNGKETGYSWVSTTNSGKLANGAALTDMILYTLADGSLIGFHEAAANCELPVGTKMTKETIEKGPSEGGIAPCWGFIDVNGVSLPNKEVTCSNGTTNAAVDTPCVVKNDANHMGDIFPIVFHDSTVEPASNAARYILQTTK